MTLKLLSTIKESTYWVHINPQSGTGFSACYVLVVHTIKYLITHTIKEDIVAVMTDNSGEVELIKKKDTDLVI